MNKWWLNQPEERYWLECTGRDDLGANLNAPIYNERGKEDWHYILLRDLKIGDVVFHYSTKEKAIIGRSIVARSAFEDRVIWGAKGPTATAKGVQPYERAGLRVGIRDYHVLAKPVTQELIRASEALLRESSERLKARFGNSLYLPIELGSRDSGPRVLPGYMFKLSVDYVNILGLDEVLDDSEDNQHESELQSRNDIPETEKSQLIRARRGQGMFRTNVSLIEKKCRITDLSSLEHLRASHIKPWRLSSSREKLDGNNGLLLSPHVDHLFDRGYISFTVNGSLLVSPQITNDVLTAWNIDQNLNAGRFLPEQEIYLRFHRDNVFKQ